MLRRILPSLFFLILIFFLTLGVCATHGQPRSRPQSPAPQTQPAFQSISVADLAGKLEQLTNGLEPAIRLSFRLRAADVLQNAYPELAGKFIALSLAEINKSHEVTLDQTSFSALAQLAPADAVAVIDHLSHSPVDSSETLVTLLVFGRHFDEALALYRHLLSHEHLALGAAQALVRELRTQKPDEASKLFQEIVTKFPFDSADWLQTWMLVELANAVRSIAPGPAADAYERIIKLATPPDFGKSPFQMVTVKLKIGSTPMETANSRETILVMAGVGLHAVAPDRFEKVRGVFGDRDLTGPVTAMSIASYVDSPAATSNANPTDQLIASFNEKNYAIVMSQTGSDRSKLVVEAAKEIQSLTAGNVKMALVFALASTCQGGDLDRPAVAAVATMLKDALRQETGAPDTYINLARLIRYESAGASEPMPALVAALTLLELQDKANQQGGFTLKGLDGKEYSLAALHGKVVVLNFWSTWCGACVAEFPALEKLNREFAKRGLVVLAVSDQERAMVDAFIQKQGYTFTVLLDPQRKVSYAFDVVGVPQSFIFDREGRLVSQISGTRTEEQFRDLLKMAGLQ